MGVRPGSYQLPFDKRAIAWSKRQQALSDKWVSAQSYLDPELVPGWDAVPETFLILEPGTSLAIYISLLSQPALSPTVFSEGL